jgi:hypothetical protein
MQDKSGFLTDELSDGKKWFTGDPDNIEHIKDKKYYNLAYVFEGIFP